MDPPVGSNRKGKRKSTTSATAPTDSTKRRSSQQPQPRAQSCSTCRAMNLECDRRQPYCGPCMRTSRVCSYQQPSQLPFTLPLPPLPTLPSWSPPTSSMARGTATEALPTGTTPLVNGENGVAARILERSKRVQGLEDRMKSLEDAITSRQHHPSHPSPTCDPAHSPPSSTSTPPSTLPPLPLPHPNPLPRILTSIPIMLPTPISLSPASSIAHQSALQSKSQPKPTAEESERITLHHERQKLAFLEHKKNLEELMELQKKHFPPPIDRSGWRSERTPVVGTSGVSVGYNGQQQEEHFTMPPLQTRSYAPHHNQSDYNQNHRRQPSSSSTQFSSSSTASPSMPPMDWAPLPISTTTAPQSHVFALPSPTQALSFDYSPTTATFSYINRSEPQPPLRYDPYSIPPSYSSHPPSHQQNQQQHQTRRLSSSIPEIPESAFSRFTPPQIPSLESYDPSLFFSSLTNGGNISGSGSNDGTVTGGGGGSYWDITSAGGHSSHSPGNWFDNNNTGGCYSENDLTSPLANGSHRSERKYEPNGLGGMGGYSNAGGGDWR